MDSPAPARFVALHVESARLEADAIEKLGQQYRLTKREQEALRHFSLGLSTVEVAKRMTINSQTVKAFLRGII